MVDLAGKVAVVTGGTRGIGRAVTEALLRKDCSVALGARTGEDVEECVRALSGRYPGRVSGVACDVRREADCERLIAHAVETYGRLDVLVNNAGVGMFEPVASTTTEAWRTQIETNLNGVFFCTRAALPHLKGAGGGWVINIGSLAGRNPFAGGAAYNATKFGLIGFTEALMLEVRHDGVRVTCVMPGSVDTDFAPGEGEASWKLQGDDIARVVLDLLAFPERALPSRIEIRPAKPPRK